VEFGRFCRGEKRNFANWPAEFGKIYRGKLWALLMLLLWLHVLQHLFDSLIEMVVCVVIKDGARDGNIGLPEELQLRLQFSTSAATANSAPKQHRKKKIASSDQVSRRKEFDLDQKNSTQSTHAAERHVLLVFLLYNCALGI